MSYKNLVKKAEEFKKLAETPQLQEVQPGDIADAFPEFFPTKFQENNGQKSPFFNKLDAFLSSLLPEDANAKIVFFVKPGWIVAPQSTFTRGGKPVANPKWTSAIAAFVAKETNSLPSLAVEKMKGKVLKNTLQVATYTL